MPLLRWVGGCVCVGGGPGQSLEGTSGPPAGDFSLKDHTNRKHTSFGRNHIHQKGTWFNQLFCSLSVSSFPSALLFYLLNIIKLRIVATAARLKRPHKGSGRDISISKEVLLSPLSVRLSQLVSILSVLVFLSSSAYDVVLRQKVAVKKLSRPFQSLIHGRRSYRELRLLKHMKHENVSAAF